MYFIFSSLSSHQSPLAHVLVLVPIVNYNSHLSREKYQTRHRMDFYMLQVMTKQHQYEELQRSAIFPIEFPSPQFPLFPAIRPAVCVDKKQEESFAMFVLNFARRIKAPQMKRYFAAR